MRSLSLLITTHVVLGWLLGKSTDIVELFEAQLLSSILMENSAATTNVLETSKLGQSPSPMWAGRF